MAIEAVGARDTGLTVEGRYTSVAAVRRAPQVKSLHTVVLGVSVRVVPGVAATPLIGRDTDLPPFDAGGLMFSPSLIAYCTSGFAIEYAGNPHTTTARHCAASESPRWPGIAAVRSSPWPASHPAMSGRSA